MVRRVLVVVGSVIAVALSSAAPALATQPYMLNYNKVNFSSGTLDGLVNTNGTLTLASGQHPTFDYLDPHAAVPVLGRPVDGSGMYVYGTWTSPAYDSSFPFTELISSWNAQTSPGTWIQSEVKPLIDNGHWAKWYILGRWTYNDSDFHRTSVGGQGDADGFVAVDTLFTKDHPAVAYQLRLTIFRRVLSSAPVSVSRYSAVVSNLRNQRSTFPSATTINQEIDLGLPSYSQEIHHGEYPEFDNGGEAWCSPTSTAMVVQYWEDRTGTSYAPTDAETSWVGFDDPDVDYTARFVYDYRYQGAGNWPFNTAYAAQRGLVGDVTMLHNLSEAEPFIREGIPLVASVAWSSNKLDTAIKSTNGHLMVIGGFKADGRVIAYDPASDTNDLVRHVYDREQFERAWIPASGGVVYVIRPQGYRTALVEALLTAHNS